MVGKSLRHLESKQDSSEDEFPSLNKSKKGNASSQRSEDNNILDGFDVEGLTEQEVEDLKKAIMESRNEMPGRVDLLDEKCDNDAPVFDEQKGVGNIDEDDDDETQPPEDMEEDFGFNLIEPTLVDTDESTEDLMPEDKKRASPVIDDKYVPNSNETKDGRCGSSQSFEPMEDEKVDVCDDRSQKSASSTSSTIESNNNKQNQETKSTSQTYSQTDAVGPKQLGDHPKAGEAHLPLHRHYRAVCTQTVKNTDYYFSRDENVSECSAKAIYQLFEIFRMNLKKAQHECREKLPWGLPVKPGSHQSRTIDIKRRGHDSFYLDLSQDSEDEIEKNPTSSRGRPLRKPKSQSPDKSDDELPDLIVEDASSIKGRPLRRRKLHEKNYLETHSKSSATKHIELENSDDEFRFQESKPKLVRKTSVQNKIHEKTFVDNTFGTFDSKRPRKQRSNKKTDASTKVLVEETQDDFGDAEYVRQRKEDSEITVCETQTEDDNLDWLNVRKTSAGERFENPMHQAKLKDYTIRKIPHSKSHNKTTNKPESVIEMSEESLENVGEKQQEKVEKQQEKGEKWQDKGEKHEKQHEKGEKQQEKGEKHKKRQEKGEKHQANAPVNEDVEIKENQQPVKRKKRKAKKNESKVLVEETQDIDIEADISDTITGGRKRVKRKCFKLGSSSEEESVADTQDYTPEQEADVCVNDLNVDSNEADDKNDEFNEKGSKVCQNDPSENSQSPVIKKSKKSSVTASKKGGTGVIILDEETEEKANVGDNFQGQPKLRTISGYRTSVRKGKTLKKSALDANISEKNDVPKGVKKLFNRPVSTESIDLNNSDNVSTTSSQRSSMIIDDQGDLYSTQFCEIKGRKRKKVEESKANSSQTFEQKMKEFEQILTPDKADAGITASNMNWTLTTNSQNTNTNKLSNPKVEKVPKSTKNLNKTLGVSSNVPIDIDSDSGGEAEEIVIERGRSQNPRQQTHSNVFVKTTQQRKPIISLNDVATAKEVRQVKADINQSACNVKPVACEDRAQSASSKEAEMVEEDEGNNDSSPDIFSFDLDEDPLAGYIKGSNKGPNTKRRVNKKGNVNWSETKIETEGSVDYSGDVSHREGTDRSMRDNEKLQQGQSRGRKRQRSEDIEEEPITKEIPTIECPICVRLFPVNVIEAHAADCNGPPMEEEETTNHTSQTSHDRAEDNVRHNRSNHKHGVRETSPDDNHIDLVQQPNIVGDDFNVLKQLSATRQDDGEPQTCWICERLIKTQYKLHVERCYDEAAKQQRELEEKGFSEVHHEPEREAVSPARTTRGRLRQQNDDGDTPRQKMNNIKVTKVERHLREEGEITPTRVGRGVGRKRQERTHTLQATSTEDGYNSDKTRDSEFSDSTDGSSWDSGSMSDSSDDNISLASVVRSGSSALVTGPWNNQSNPSKNMNQSSNSNCNSIPDWIREGMNSPIRSFVPISQQEDAEYFQKQFSFKQKNVEKRMQKRKRATGNKRRKKRRKVRRTKK